MEMQKRSSELNMKVSSVCRKEGKQIAYVTFSDAYRTAEGVIPDCRMIDNHGFDPSEVAQLECYMKANLSTLKKMASSVDIMDAFVGKEL